MADSKYIDLIAKYLSGNISTPEQTELLQWAESSQDNQKFFEEMVQLWSIAGAYEDDAFEADTSAAWNQLDKRIDDGTRPAASGGSARIIPLSMRSILRVAAATLLLIAASYGVYTAWVGNISNQPVLVSEETSTDETREILFKLAHEVDSAIERKGQIPGIISLLPLEGLDRDKVRYFHNHIILNHHFFVADENILGLDQQTDCALGIYHEQGNEYCLLLVRYKGAADATKALTDFTDVYMPDASQPGLVQTEDRKWTAAQAEDDLLIIIFGAFSKKHALKILEGVAS